jgi:hypothetical protein
VQNCSLCEAACIHTELAFFSREKSVANPEKARLIILQALFQKQLFAGFNASRSFFYIYGILKRNEVFSAFNLLLTLFLKA